jgi:hypothetical protein
MSCFFSQQIVFKNTFTECQLLNIIILQAVVHAWRHHHIIGISAYFCYMRVAYTIDSQKSEDHCITDILS